jgi:hypothetical protein
VLRSFKLLTVKLAETEKSTPEKIPALASATSFTARLEALPGIT